MEVHKNVCYKCGGTCEGEIQAGWFTCRDCKTKQPRYMFVHRLTPLALDAAMPPSAEPDSGLESVPAVESDTQPRK